MIIKDIDGLLQVFQIPLDAADAVAQLIGRPVILLLRYGAGVVKQLAPALVQATRILHRFLNLTEKQRENRVIKTILINFENCTNLISCRVKNTS